MVDKLTTANTYTDAELLALFREALAIVSISGQSYTMQLPGGGQRTWTSVDASKLAQLVAEWEAKLTSSSNGLATNYVRLVRV